MVKWIKLSTSMFDDEKIKIIESMPEGDSILVIWIRLLTLAGKVNDDGFVYLEEHIPYTTEMLSTIFGRKHSTIKLAISTFERLSMIEIIDGKILIANFNKHQNMEGLADIKRKEQARLRQAKHRAKKKEESNADVTLLSHNESRKITSLELDIDIEEEKEKTSIVNSVKEVISYLNQKAGKNYRYQATGTKKWVEARLNEKFTIEELKHVVDVKCAEWLGTSHEKYLRPETLFGNKCDGYRNQPMPRKQQSDNNKQKSNSFHNFDGRMQNYSPDELEAKWHAKHGREKGD